MTTLRSLKFLAVAVAVVFASGCGNHRARVTQPDGASLEADASNGKRLPRTGESSGPVLCFQAASLSYCYPAPGYCACPEAEVAHKVLADSVMYMSWMGDAGSKRSIRAYRWAVDIADVSDNTPRTDEDTDLSHWSQPSPEATAVALGPWPANDVHRLYVEVEDDMGFKSLGILRIEVRGTHRADPGLGGR